MEAEHKKEKLVEMLTTATRLQQKCFDLALEAADLIGPDPPDLVATVAELAGALGDDEPVPAELVASLLSHPESFRRLSQCSNRQRRKPCGLWKKGRP